VQIGDWQFDLERGVLTRGKAKRRLTPKSATVLRYLVERPSELVTSEVLLELYWRGSISADNALQKSISEIRRAFGDNPRQPKYLQTVNKQGYILIASLSGGKDHLEKDDENPDLKISSLAILPFRDLSQGGEFQWLGDGIANELTVRLQGVDDLSVPAQASVERFRESDLPPASIAKELGVGLLFNGTIYDGLGSSRIYLEISNPANGGTLWTAEFSVNEDNLIEVGRRLVDETASFLGRRVSHPNRMEMPRGKAAYAAFLKYDYYNSTGDNRQRVEWINKTLTLEPDFAYGYLQAGWALQAQYSNSVTPKPETKESMRLALVKAGDLGMSEDPQWLNAWGGYLSRIEGDHPEAEKVLWRAVEGGVYTQYAHLLLASGLVDEANQLLRAATTKYPFFSADHTYLTVGLGLNNDFGSMLKAANELIRLSPKFRLGHIYQIHAMIHLGEFDAAEKKISDLSKIVETPSISWTQRFLRAHMWHASGLVEKAERSAELFERKNITAAARGIYLLLGDDRGWELTERRLTSFILDLPYELVTLPQTVREHPKMKLWIENHGYTREWRNTLRDRVKRLSLGAP